MRVDSLVLVGAVLGMAAAGLLLLVSVLSYRLPRDDDEEA